MSLVSPRGSDVGAVGRTSRDRRRATGGLGVRRSYLHDGQEPLRVAPATARNRCSIGSQEPGGGQAPIEVWQHRCLPPGLKRPPGTVVIGAATVRSFAARFGVPEIQVEPFPSRVVTGQPHEWSFHAGPSELEAPAPDRMVLHSPVMTRSLPLWIRCQAAGALRTELARWRSTNAPDTTSATRSRSSGVLTVRRR